MSTLTVAFAVAFLCIGPYVAMLSYRNYQIRQQIVSRDTTHTRNVAPNSDVEVEGTVAAQDEAISPLLPADDVVCCVWRVDTWDESGDTGIWNPSAIGVVAVPFAIADEYGEQTIHIGEHHHDLGGTGLSGQAFSGIADTVKTAQDMVQAGFADQDVVVDLQDWDTIVEIEAEDDPPETVDAFIEQTDAVGDVSDSILNIVDFGRKHGRRRYRQATLTPGDQVYALGTTDRDSVLTPGDDRGQLIVGRGTEDEMLSTVTKRFRRGSLIAVLFTVAGLAAAYFSL